MSWARCSECGETFGSDSGFDRHRITTTGEPGYDPEYDWRCATPAEIQTRGLQQDAKGWWRWEGHDPRFGPRVSPRIDADAEMAQDTA